MRFEKDPRLCDLLQRMMLLLLSLLLLSLLLESVGGRRYPEMKHRSPLSFEREYFECESNTVVSGARFGGEVLFCFRL